MSKITRYSGNVVPFANNALAGERFDFGSQSDQNTDLDSLVNADYLRGWGIIGASDFPPLEWFNAQAFTSTQFISYLHQMGVPEWDDEQEYHENSAANRNGVLYFCKTNNHVSVTPPESDTTNWRRGRAQDVSYDNTASGLVATDVQDAIDEAASGKNISFKYAVSQLANGNASRVVFIDAGVNVALYDYFIFQSDGRIYKNDGGIIGTLAGAFNPATGGDPGISGNLTNIYKINADQIFGLDQTWTSFVSPERQPGILYTNTSGKVRWVSIYVLAGAGSASLRVDGVDRSTVPSSSNGMLLAPILAGQEYQTTGTTSVNYWGEVL